MPNAPGERLTRVLPVHVVRFVRAVGRRVRLVDEISDAFLKKLVNAKQQSHMVEVGIGSFWRPWYPRTSPLRLKCNGITLLLQLKMHRKSLLLSCKGDTVLH